MTLGQTIGIINDSFSVTLDNGTKVDLAVKYDVTGASDATIKGWICGNRRIVRQGGIRKLTTAEAKALNGKTFIENGQNARIHVDPEVATLQRAETDEAYFLELKAKMDAIEARKKAHLAQLEAEAAAEAAEMEAQEDQEDEETE